MKARRADAAALTAAAAAAGVAAAAAGAAMMMKMMLAVAHRHSLMIYAAWSAGTAASANRKWLCEKLKRRG